MKTIKRIKEGGFYLFESRSSANSCYFQNRQEAEKFFVYFNYYLGGYLTVYEYVLIPDGWLMMVKIKPRFKIISEWINEGNQEKAIPETWRIISERVRLMISTFVPTVNRMRGRIGSLVHSGYRRYYFETKEEGLRFIQRLRRRKIISYQGKSRYNAGKKRYRGLQKLPKGCLILSSKDGRKGKNRDKIPVGSFYSSSFPGLVLPYLIEFTTKQHSPPPP